MPNRRYRLYIGFVVFHYQQSSAASASLGYARVPTVQSSIHATPTMGESSSGSEERGYLERERERTSEPRGHQGRLRGHLRHRVPS